MREKRFVDQNKEEWARFEQITSSKESINPAEISDLFSKITGDLSYARTHYPKRSIRVYLNHLAQRIFLRLYRQRGTKFKNFKKFWTDDLPLALYHAKKELNLSLIFFLGSMAIGILSSVHDPEFPAVILGGDYVEMTERNIAEGNPMGVYKTSDEFDMFFRITLNNLMVAFRTFVLGAFFGIGTLIIMLYNGIMVGTFQYFFIERDLLQESFLTIWMHGALEISSIVIAGAAGLTMGRGLLFPGTLPRRHAFILGARRAMKIMVGLVPLFILAGFIEGFFTRLTEMPDLLRGSFILMCFAFVGAYFWWYPTLRFSKNPEPHRREDELSPETLRTPDLKKLRKSKDIFNTTFSLFRLLLPQIFSFSLVISTLYIIAFFFIGGSSAISDVGFTKFSLFNLYRFHDYDIFPFCFFLNWIFLFGIFVGSVKWLQKISKRDGSGITPRLLIAALIITGIFELLILSDRTFIAFLAVIAIPFLVFWYVASVYGNQALPKAFRQMVNLQQGTGRNIFASFFYIASISIIVLFLVDSPFTWFYLEIIQWNIEAEESTKKTIAVLSLIFVNHFGLALLLPLTIYAQVLEYHSALEVKTGKALEERVNQIGLVQKAYGMEKE